MAWSTPLTAAANAALTSAQWNASVRDNLLETAVAKAANAGGYFVATGVNSVAQRMWAQNIVDTAEDGVDSTYSNLATNGPLVTVTCGPTMLVIVNSQHNMAGTGFAASSFEHTGATTSVASDVRAYITDITVDTAAIAEWAGSRCSLQGVTPGSNTVRMQYRVSLSPVQFRRRRLQVMPL